MFYQIISDMIVYQMKKFILPSFEYIRKYDEKYMYEEANIIFRLNFSQSADSNIYNKIKSININNIFTISSNTENAKINYTYENILYTIQFPIEIINISCQEHNISLRPIIQIITIECSFNYKIFTILIDVRNILISLDLLV